jgi:predicted nucleic acid-binding protein
MKQQIVITDACVFIDLFELGIISDFFSLQLEIHTTTNVIFELDVEQQAELALFEQAGKIHVHVLTPDDFTEIQSNYLSKSLSIADKSVLFLAVKLDAIVLSSDRLVRSHAKQVGLNYHGLIWIIQFMINQQVLVPIKAQQAVLFMLNNPNLFRLNLEMQESLIKIKDSF